MLPGQEAVGQSSNNGFWRGHSQEKKAGVQDSKVPAGTGQPKVFGHGQRWSMGSLVPRVSPAAHPCLALGMSCCPRDVPIPARAVGIPMALIPKYSQVGRPPICPHHRSKTDPQFPRSQCAAPMLSRRLLLLNCTNETTLIKAIAPQLWAGVAGSVGLPSCSPAPALSRMRVPSLGTWCWSHPRGHGVTQILPARAQSWALVLGWLQLRDHSTDLKVLPVLRP